ncbi:MAG TPA: winged helix DNA-binding domain-containing protein [Ktedonobacterales bacterium]|nr:winged helix DNA-binding domain-containing protein [Ktedonobacterales bacterium]
MTPADIGLRRLARQRLTGQRFATPAEVVGWLGAVQSQEYLGAIWSLGIRMGADVTDAVIERAFTEGTILRTHVMRPTWHFVAPADIRWLLELTAPRIKATMAYYDRQLGLDDALYARCNEIIARALEGGKHLTRAELGKALAESGIVVEGQQLAHIVSHAELDAVVCSGPRRGKQFTYALLAERAPTAKTLPRDEALAELTQRYFTSHGPATARDFAWWSGLTMADIRAGLEMVGADLGHEEIAGQTYWFPDSLSPAIEPSETAFLLPTYDEFLVGYQGFGAALTGGRGNGERATFSATIVIDGRVVGNWRRTIVRGAVVVELAPFAPLTASEREAVFAAASRFGAFLGMSVECVGA